MGLDQICNESYFDLSRFLSDIIIRKHEVWAWLSCLCLTEPLYQAGIRQVFKILNLFPQDGFLTRDPEGQL